MVYLKHICIDNLVFRLAGYRTPNNMTFLRVGMLRTATQRISRSSAHHQRSTSAAVFSTQAKSSSDNFLSGQSSLYAESMFEQYENDPNSVPEVRYCLFSVSICYYLQWGMFLTCYDFNPSIKSYQYTTELEGIF